MLGNFYQKNGVFWDVTLCGRTDISEELSASIIGVTRIGELGTTLTIDDGGTKFLQNVGSCKSHTA
jgi:hypothetical protein